MRFYTSKGGRNKMTILFFLNIMQFLENYYVIICLFGFLALRLNAVLLTFGSPTFKKPSDVFLPDKDYTIQKDQDLRIYRLFNFSSYIPSTYEIQHPVSKTYNLLLK